MSLSRGVAKAERVTLTLVPTGSERSFPSLPSTFNVLRHLYEWRRAAKINYMLVPRKVSSHEILVDLFMNFKRKENVPREILKIAHALVDEKMQSEWKGIRLGKIGRPTTATPPQKLYVRGTIEDILGVEIER